MKKILSYLLAGAVILCQASCNKNAPDDDIPQPVVTAKGTPAGVAFTKEIGPAGGQLQSADGAVHVNIPAGALSAATTVGIQPIGNTAPLGMGKGYRLTPEGTTFARPVTISLKYDPDSLAGSSSDFLWILSQQNDGSWVGHKKSEVDVNAKTVSVETTHFSDWVVGKFIEMAITPASRSVKVKESLQLSVTGCGFWGKDDADLIPFIPVNESLDRLAAWKGNFAIDNSWTLNGTKAPVSNVSGSLQPGADGSAATYTAPDNVPSQNPVAIAVSLTQKQSNGPTGRFMLVSNIRVYDEYFARVTVQGVTTEFSGTEIFTGVPGVVPSGGNVASAIMLGDGTLSLMFQHVTRNLIVALSCKNPAKGSISFITRDHATGAGVQYNKLSSNTPLTTYSSSSSQLINANGKCGYSGAPSSGSLALTEYKNEKGVIVMGSFSGTIWNVGNVPGCANSSTPISGEFAMPLFK